MIRKLTVEEQSRLSEESSQALAQIPTRRRTRSPRTIAAGAAPGRHRLGASRNPAGTRTRTRLRKLGCAQTATHGRSAGAPDSCRTPRRVSRARHPELWNSTRRSTVGPGLSRRSIATRICSANSREARRDRARQHSRCRAVRGRRGSETCTRAGQARRIAQRRSTDVGTAPVSCIRTPAYRSSGRERRRDCSTPARLRRESQCADDRWRESFHGRDRIHRRR